MTKTALTVIVADDDISSCLIVQQLLKAWGFTSQILQDGSLAAEAIYQSKKPVLAILDWHMPGKSGVDVSRMLMERPPSQPFYTIILTANSTKSDITTALDSGAHDFMVKPFNSAELRARLNVGIRVIGLQVQQIEINLKLAKYTQSIEKIAEERARQLSHADRLSTLGFLTAGIAHEINNPTAFVSGNIQVLQKNWPLLKALIDKVPPESLDEKTKYLIDEIPGMFTDMRNGIQRITEIVNALKDYARPDSSTKQVINVNQSIQESLKICQNRLKHHAQVNQRLMEEIAPIHANAQKLEQVIINLLVNASDALEQIGGGTIDITTLQESDQVTIAVRDTGPGLSTVVLENLFKLFYTTKEVGKGTGLGLPISQKIITDMGGTLSAANHPDGGAIFTITLPILVEQEKPS